MSKIKRPTASLLFGGREKAKGHDVILRIGNGWATNGHWMVRLDRFKTEPRATKGVFTQELSEKQVNMLTQGLGEIPAMSVGRVESVGNDNGEITEFGNATAKGPGNTRRRVRTQYVEWLSGLNGDWFIASTPHTPMQIKNRAGETIAIVMGVRF